MELAFNSSKCEEFVVIDPDLRILPHDSQKKYWQIFKGKDGEVYGTSAGIPILLEIYAYDNLCVSEITSEDISSITCSA